MEEFEHKLKRALARANVPDGFGERVLAKIVRKEMGKRSTGDFVTMVREWFSARACRGALTGALVLLLTGTLFFVSYEKHGAWQQQAERIRGEQASAKLLRALNLTGTELARVRQLLILAPQSSQPTEKHSRP